MKRILFIVASLLCGSAFAQGIPTGIDGTSQVVSLSTSSAQSSAIDGAWVDVTCSADCFVALGANPTATTTTSRLLSGGQTYRLKLWTTSLKVAGILASGTGSLYVTPLQ